MWHIAVMSLPFGPVGGVATIKFESMVMLPPVAWLPALAEIRLSLSMRRRSKPESVMFAPPSKLLLAVWASNVPPLRRTELAWIGHSVQK